MFFFGFFLFYLSIVRLSCSNDLEAAEDAKKLPFSELWSKFPSRPSNKENTTSPSENGGNTGGCSSNTNNITKPESINENNGENGDSNNTASLIPCRWEDGVQICPNVTGIIPQQCPFQKRNVLPPSQQNAGDQCSATSITCDPNNIYYTYDGSCNNLQIPHWAQTRTAYTRFIPASYEDEYCAVRKTVNGSALPLARVVRTSLIKSNNIYSTRFNILFYGFGQWVDHDVTKFEPIESAELCCSNGKVSAVQPPDLCLPIIIPPNDPFYSKLGIECLDVKRAINTKSDGCTQVRPCVPINHVTGVFDISLLYGSDHAIATKLRTFRDGLLKSSFDGDEVFPPTVSGSTQCPAGGLTPQPGSTCSLSADGRIDQNPEIYVIDVMFLRIHNYIATILHKLNPTWDDEILYQEARRIFIALYQHVIYAEHVPLMLGYQTSSVYKLLPSTSGYASGYDPKLNPQTIVEYSFAAGRTTHSMVAGAVSYLDSNGKPTSYLLRNKYFNQGFTHDKNVFLNLVQSYSTKLCKRQDIYGDEETNDWLFHVPGQAFGLDLQSIDINRGLDAGIPPYNQVRQACGLCKLNNFKEFVDEVTDPEDIPVLESLYKNIDAVDLYVGGLMEKPLSGSLYGPTLSCVLGEAFYRWKIGDRLYYEFPTAKFTLPQLSSIRKASFAWFLCRGNPKLSYVARKAFLVSSTDNPLVRCSDIPDIDFTLWKAA